MISFDAVRAVARAEARVARRLVRYWVFLSLSALVCVGSFANLHFIHYVFSAYSASAASVNPRYFMASFGLNFLLVYTASIVFLGFDVRARDQRERMAEVLDARPCSNVELLTGKLAGLFLVTWIPTVVMTLLLWVVGLLLHNPLQPLSMLSFVLFMAPPAFVLVIALVFFITLLVRHRLLAALASMAVIILAFWVSLWWIPVYAYAAADLAGGISLPFPSDILGGLIGGVGLIQRTAYLLGGVALLLFAAAIHPRPDDGSRGRRAAAGAGVLAVAAGMIGGLVLHMHGGIAAQARWAAAHEARRDALVPDLLRLEGRATIEPAKSLALDVTLRFRAPADRGLERALFTLNPGLVVSSVKDGAGGALTFTHEDGLLDIALPRPLAPGEETAIALTAAGFPDPMFAYLRGAFDPRQLEPAKAQVVVLGLENQIFKRQLVALLPGVRWLPVSGAESVRSASDGRSTDFFQVDLTVDLPEEWLAAGPGRRQPAEQAAGPGRVRFRFAPQGYLPEVALVAGHYVSAATEVDGVVFEVLVHPTHRANLEFFEDATREIGEWLQERMAEAKRVGLDYPYDGLTLVEVPGELRGYSGGWRMDSTLIQPGMILMREAGFPTARFDAKVADYERAGEREGGIPRAKRQGLIRFFENDMNGGNPFVGAARSVFGYQTAGAGRAALPLEFTLESLTSKVLTDRQGYFSVHFFRDPDFGETFAKAGMASRDEDRVGNTYADVFTHLVTSTPEVWDSVLGRSLVDMDPWEDPKRTVNALALKGGAMARSMFDALGREQTGRCLSALRRRTAGRTFTAEDLVAAGDEVGVDLRSWLDVWIEGTGLAGFTLGPVSYVRLADAQDGAARYQTLVTLRNAESATGLARLEYVQEGQGQARAWGDPVTVPGNSAVELGLVTPVPLRILRVQPYFSLNRDPFAVPLPEVDRERIVPGEPFSGARVWAWSAADGGVIVVDDLDPGFAIEEVSGALMRVTGRGSEEARDQGLPISEQDLKPRRWSRAAVSYAWGRYRRTMAVIRPGDGKQAAVFSADLPASGRWELEYHLPRPTGGSSRKLGKWKFSLDDGQSPRDVTLDTDAANVGWNSLGIFDLRAGAVKLEVPNATDGYHVAADAIRWTPVSGAAGQEAAR